MAIGARRKGVVFQFECLLAVNTKECACAVTSPVLCVMAFSAFHQKLKAFAGTLQ